MNRLGFEQRHLANQISLVPGFSMYADFHDRLLCVHRWLILDFNKGGRRDDATVNYRARATGHLLTT